MASVTFGSVGDIIAVCGILYKAAKALSDSRGAPAEYQELINQLQGLTQFLESLRTLLRERPRLRKRVQLQQALRSCWDCLTREYEILKPYQTSLQKNPSTTKVQKVLRSIRWLSTKDDRAAFQAAIIAHVAAIQGILTISGIDVVQELHHDTTGHLERGFEKLTIAHEELANLEASRQSTTIATIRQSETTIVVGQSAMQQQMHEDITTLRQEVKDLRLVVIRNGNHPNRSSSRANSTVMTTSSLDRSKLFLCAVIQVLSELTQYGWIGVYQFLQMMQWLGIHATLPEAPSMHVFVVYDFFREPMYIDPNLIPYQVFIDLLSRRCRRILDFSLVKSRLFAFEDQKRRVSNLDQAWSTDLQAGKAYFMSLYNRHDDPFEHKSFMFFIKTGMELSWNMNSRIHDSFWRRIHHPIGVRSLNDQSKESANNMTTDEWSDFIRATIKEFTVEEWLWLVEQISTVGPAQVPDIQSRAEFSSLLLEEAANRFDSIFWRTWKAINNCLDNINDLTRKHGILSAA